MITTDTREYRSIEIRTDDVKPENVIEGYAVVFDDPEVMFKDGATEYKEQIDAHAFDGAEIDDVILNENHEGQALARTRNGSLKLEIDEKGLKVTADMSGSQKSREIYEAVKNGLYDRMSFAFTVSEDNYDADSHTRTIQKIDRLYDVSVVNFPAYEATSVSARNFYEAKAEAERKAAEAVKEAERKREEIRNMIREVLDGKN